jgi:hypothetical protein
MDDDGGVFPHPPSGFNWHVYSYQQDFQGEDWSIADDSSSGYQQNSSSVMQQPQWQPRFPGISVRWSALPLAPSPTTMTLSRAVSKFDRT